jgi:hypothetical protein
MTHLKQSNMANENINEAEKPQMNIPDVIGRASHKLK